jgi:uncharacterized protein YdgA (DUF945 family)
MARKLLILALALLAVAAIGAPFMFGAKAEQIHHEFADRLAAQGSTGLKSSDFSKGWFKSSARDVLEVCSATRGCRELVISSVIHHGPIAITGILDGVAPMRPLQAAMISSVRLEGLFGDTAFTPALPDMTVTTLAELDGNSVATLDMPSSQHTIEGKSGKLTLALGGLSGEFAGTAGTRAVKGSLKFPSLKLEDQSGFSMTLANLSADVDGEMGEAGFKGKAGERIGDITLKASAQDPQPLTLKDLDISLTGSRSSDGLAQNQFKGGIKAISAAGREYGPAALEGETVRINRAAMTRLQQEVAALEAQKKPPQEMLPAMMAIYQKGIPEVLKSRPEFNLKSLSLKTPEGDVLASLKLVGVPPQGELNMGAWLNLLQAEFSLQVPAVTLWNILDAQMQRAAQAEAVKTGQSPVLPTQDQIGAKVTELVNANVFAPKLDANAYTLQVAMLEGRLLINGQENQAFGNLMQLMSGPQAAMPPGAGMQEAPPAP